MAVISNPFLNEILEERFYPFLEHIKEFFGFGNEDEATLSRLELQSSTDGSRNQDVVHRTSSDSKVYQQTWKNHHHHQNNDDEFTAGNSCCQKLTGRSNSSTTEAPSTKTPNHGPHASLPSPPTTTTKAGGVQCDHGGGGNSTAAAAAAAAAAAKSGWLSRSPLRAFTSIPATIVAAPNADSSPTKNVGGTPSPSTGSVSTRESNGRPSSDYAVPPHPSTAAAAAANDATGGGGGGGGGGIVSAYDCNPLLMFPTEEQLQSVEEPDYSTCEYLGRLQFSVSYDLLSQTLTVKITRAEELAAKDLSGTSDPYVKIMLLPDKKNTMTTNIKRKNLNPRWNEVFAFEGFPQHKLLTRTLYLLVLDYDRFSRDDPIGEVCIPLRQMDLLTGQTVWSNLQPCKGAVGRLGALLLSLCYQPGIGCITLAIVKAKDLKAKDINGLSDPYVKIWLMHDGKRVEKKKTEVKEKTLNPTFNDSFLFSVPYERIRQTSLIVSVMDFDRLGRNEPIGQVLLGSKSGPMEVKHWNEMFAKTRQPVVQWHVLKDLG